MNYMYGEGVADELEADAVVRKINRMVEACEPGVQTLVRWKMRQRQETARFQQGLRSLPDFSPLQAQNQQGSTLSALIGQNPFGRIW